MPFANFTALEVNCDQFCLDQRDLALNEKVGPLALEVSMFLAVTGNPLHVATTPLQKVKSNLKHFKAVCDVCVYSFGGKTVGQCWPVAKWQLLFCFTGTAPAASEQKPHRRHQRRDVHQPSLERQPACLAGVIEIDDCGHNCRKRNLAHCSTLVLARA